MSLRKDLETMNIDCWKNDMVKIKPMTTEKELIYAAYECQLTEEQRNMISPLWFIIGRAYLNKDDYFPCIIYSLDDKPIGFISFSTWIGNGEAYSWSYFIDLKYQGNGYGRSAAQLAINILKTANSYKTIKLATEKSNIKAYKLYMSLGFHESSEIDGDDIVFEL